ncbi:MAG: hypothetical protein FWC16_07655 [Defluviitaleaceae bacterium]|nr:hypothetical protein [Defluviitaleaceae bacterium]MCL2274790.1 hypothetical protein [Defluviitaleaceae bacterium]
MIATRNPHEYEIIGARRFHEMQAGDMFRARVHDVQPGKVTLKFNDGTTYTARSMVLPDARIGEDSVFLVKENDGEGRIVLEMVRLAAQTKQDNMLREALHNAGISVTKENLTLGRQMLNAGIPVDTSTLHNAALHRLHTNPNALMEAAPEEVKEITRFLARTASRRTYHAINRHAELHVFKHSAKTTGILAVNAPNLGRIEITLEHAIGHPLAFTYRSEKAETHDLIAAHKPNDTHGLITAPFTLFTAPPINEETQKPSPQRFNFDIRV